MALQTIVSREVRPGDAAVVTVGSIHGGTRENIIPNEVDLQLTIRSFSEEARNIAISAVKRITKHTALASGVAVSAGPEVIVEHVANAVYNDPKLVKRLLPAWQGFLGADNVVRREAEMAGEHFAEYGREGIPSLMFRLGTIDAERIRKLPPGLLLPSQHSSRYWPALHPTIETGVAALVVAALELVGHNR